MATKIVRVYSEERTCGCPAPLDDDGYCTLCDAPPQPVITEVTVPVKGN